MKKIILFIFIISFSLFANSLQSVSVNQNIGRSLNAKSHQSKSNIQFNYFYKDINIIPSFERQSRWDKSSLQYGIQAYWKMGKGIYLHGSYLHSSDILYPSRNAILEFSKSLGNTWESSLGIQNFKPQNGPNLYMPFNNITKYINDHFLQIQIKPVFFQGSFEALSSTLKFHIIKDNIKIIPRVSLGKELELLNQKTLNFTLVNFQEYGLQAKYTINKSWEVHPDIAYRSEKSDLFIQSENNFIFSNITGVYNF